HLRIDLEEHDHAALAAEVPDVVRHVRGKLDDRAGGHDHLVAVDPHGRGALEDVDRLLLARMTVHDRRLTGLIAGDLRPELVGLEQHLAHALVGGKGLERVEIEDLGDARRHGNRGLVHRQPLLGDWWATVYLGSGGGLLTWREFGSTVPRRRDRQRAMEIRSLRGYRYAGSEARDISAVVAPPYDQISPEMQERLYTMSPHNIVRVTYPKDAADKYRDAREVLNGWLTGGIWAREEWPAIYPYHQTYTVGDRSGTRMGFVALGERSHYARAVVLPHHRTHAGPKRDRMQLLEATGVDIGLLFMLTADPGGELQRATTPIREPIAEARDLQGERHRLLR